MTDFIPDQGNDEQKDSDSGKNNLPEWIPVINPVGAAFIGLIGAFILYQFVGGTLTLLIFGLNIDEAPVDGVRLMTSAGQILFILLPALVFAKWFYEDVGTIIRFKSADLKGILLFVLGIIILTPLLQSYIAIQNYFFFKLAANYEFVNSIKSAFDSLNELVEKTYGNLLNANSAIEAVFVIIVIAVVPAVCEEVMFRGYVQKSFEFKLKPLWAIVITSVFFGLYHFNPYGMIPLILLGAYFGFAAYLSNSIMIPVILHFLNNFTAVMLYFTLGSEELIKSAAEQEIDLSSTVLFFFVLLAMFSFLMVYVVKYYKKND